MTSTIASLPYDAEEYSTTANVCVSSCHQQNRVINSGNSERMLIDCHSSFESMIAEEQSLTSATYIIEPNGISVTDSFSFQDEGEEQTQHQSSFEDNHSLSEPMKLRDCSSDTLEDYPFSNTLEDKHKILFDLTLLLLPNTPRGYLTRQEDYGDEDSLFSQDSIRVAKARQQRKKAF